MWGPRTELISSGLVTISPTLYTLSSETGSPSELIDWVYLYYTHELAGYFLRHLLSARVAHVIMPGFFYSTWDLAIWTQVLRHAQRAHCWESHHPSSASTSFSSSSFILYPPLPSFLNPESWDSRRAHPHLPKCFDLKVPDFKHFFSYHLFKHYERFWRQ